jgi:flavin-dependent dehydrogenase
MLDVETIIVGGGPAGSTCAWKLREAGRQVLILDKEPFPRVKLCAGWITEGVFKSLRFTPREYPHSIVKLKFKFHIKSWPITIRLPFAYSYSIRRVEFDHWLLRRSGADVAQHRVRRIEQDADGRYVIDGEYRCKFLVGAGGTACPVRAQLFPPFPSKVDQIATLEKEFLYPQRDEYCHVFLFQHGLRGYSWYVPKGDGYVNIGLGGVSRFFKQSGENIHRHFKRFLDDLVSAGLLDRKTADGLQETGHPYYVAPVDRGERLKQDHCYLIGDAAGFASRDLGEGIAPAIDSGLLAAEEILGTGVYASDRIATRSIPFGPAHRWLLREIHG